MLEVWFGESERRMDFWCFCFSLLFGSAETDLVNFPSGSKAGDINRILGHYFQS